MKLRSFLLCLLWLPTLHAASSPLLTEVVEKLADDRSRWRFTQFVREYDGDTIAQERLESYDLSRGEDRRWKLVSINGHPPTPAEEDPWNKRKNRPRKREPKPLMDYVDLENARVLARDDQTVTYELPLRRSAGWIFPGEKINVVLTLNHQTRSLERAKIGIAGPFNVALGFARIINLDFDLEAPSEDNAEQASGAGYAVVNKLGRRVEYVWSDFTLGPEPAGDR